ncbi:hypothetical protein, partial [Pseudomonas chlororaphis]|uniref:hypothetical protein n=1 Tax=Pseudomonas chlororaphis TaxID=587753 RepID=UPI003990454E
HLWLVVDQDQGAVAWVEQFTDRHGAFLLMSIAKWVKALIYKIRELGAGSAGEALLPAWWLI